MVVTAFIMSSLLAAPIDAGSDPLEEISIRNAGIPKLHSVTIEANGATAPEQDNAAAACEKFAVRSRDVREFLTKAGSVTSQEYLHALDWSPCYASGRVRFANGKAGYWAFHQYRAGTLTMDDGRVIHLYCPRCRSKVFMID